MSQGNEKERKNEYQSNTSTVTYSVKFVISYSINMPPTKSIQMNLYECRYTLICMCVLLCMIRGSDKWSVTRQKRKAECVSYGLQYWSTWIVKKSLLTQIINAKIKGDHFSALGALCSWIILSHSHQNGQ